ncbi:hypothetical protein BDY24DRAFT_399716 [Mrakia frigida]|uniref:uncharacterized protein n=1 Tax=Mrakia frigida TaxID=29902 RepID=UPI003FCC13F5
MKKKTASETLDASKLKGRYQKAFQGLKAEVVKKDDELSRLRAKIAAGGGGGGAEAGPSTMASGSSGSTEEPKKEEKSVEHQIKSALRKRDKEYRKPMAALQHYQRTWKYWENEREKTDGFFKDKVAAETELAKIITENEAKDSARAKELTDLLTLYEHASQSLLLPIPDAEKLALVSQHLGEMAVLLATTRRAEEEEKRARRAAEEGGGEGGGEGSV